MVTPLPAQRRASSIFASFGRVALAAVALATSAIAVHAATPEIRTSAENVVPACVTPERLMTFLQSRTRNVDARYANIAELYKRHGETWHVRWDYAFFQMAVETNFLSYKKGDGDWGDVNPKQNNFAGLGTTGGGVPGDSYPDMDTGVLAQIQHLVVYSGERIANPVGARTRLKQDDIVESMAGRNGRTTFADLSRRWAADRRYGASIEWVANSYRDAFCKNPRPVEETAVVVPKRSKRVRVIEPLEPAAALGGPDPDVDQPAVGAAPTEPAPADEAAQLGLPPGSEMVQAEPLPTDKAAAAKAPSGNEPAPAKVASSTAGPVRTIWSADASASEPSADDAAKPAAPRVIEKTRTAPLPARKPVATAAVAPAPVVETAPTAAAAPESSTPKAEPEAAAGGNSAPEIETAIATTAEQPRAPAEAHSFAFAAAMPVPAPSPAQKVVATASQCRVLTASYGGKKVFVVRSTAAAETRYTVLTVLEGFERSMLDNYFKAHAPGGSSVGEFASKDAALAKAKELCPGTAAAPPAEGAGAG